MNKTLAALAAYNDDELFYRRCHELRGDVPALKEYVKSFPVKELERRGLIIPAGVFPPSLHYNGIVLAPGFMPFKMTESFHFNAKRFSGRDIFLQKHNRYSPVFQHSHEFFEIFYCLSGQGTSIVSGGTAINFTAGDLCFIAPGTVHTMEIFDDSLVVNFFIRRTTFDEIFFNLLTGGDILSRFFSGNLFLPDSIHCIVFSAGADRELRSHIFSMLREQRNADEFSNRIMQNRIEIFFSLLLRNYGASVRIYQQSGAAGVHWDIVTYINDNFRTVTLGKIARRFRLEPSYCSRLVKTLTGKNFTALVREIRMTHAKKLLRESAGKICDISYSLGFENQETFIRTFKKSAGMTPGEYRAGHVNQLP